MTDILQMTFANRFLLCISNIISQKNISFAPVNNKSTLVKEMAGQAIAWTDDDLIQWLVYASGGFNAFSEFRGLSGLCV